MSWVGVKATTKSMYFFRKSNTSSWKSSSLSLRCPRGEGKKEESGRRCAQIAFGREPKVTREKKKKKERKKKERRGREEKNAFSDTFFPKLLQEFWGRTF
jgi:hypothetical protein